MYTYIYVYIYLCILLHIYISNRELDVQHTATLCNKLPLNRLQHIVTHLNLHGEGWRRRRTAGCAASNACASELATCQCTATHFNTHQDIATQSYIPVLANRPVAIALLAPSHRPGAHSHRPPPLSRPRVFCDIYQLPKLQVYVNYRSSRSIATRICVWDAHGFMCEMHYSSHGSSNSTGTRIDVLHPPESNVPSTCI